MQKTPLMQDLKS